MKCCCKKTKKNCCVSCSIKNPKLKRLYKKFPKDHSKRELNQYDYNLLDVSQSVSFESADLNSDQKIDENELQAARDLLGSPPPPPPSPAQTCSNPSPDNTSKSYPMYFIDYDKAACRHPLVLQQEVKNICQSNVKCGIQTAPTAGISGGNIELPPSYCKIGPECKDARDLWLIEMLVANHKSVYTTKGSPEYNALRKNQNASNNQNSMYSKLSSTSNYADQLFAAWVITCRAFFSDGKTFMQADGKTPIPVGADLTRDIWPSAYIATETARGMRKPKNVNIMNWNTTKKDYETSEGAEMFSESTLYPPFSQEPSYASLAASNSARYNTMTTVPLCFTYYQWVVNYYPLQRIPIKPQSLNTAASIDNQWKNLVPASYLFGLGPNSQNYPIFIVEWVLIQSVDSTSANWDDYVDYDDTIKKYFFPVVKWVLGDWSRVHMDDKSYSRFSKIFVPSPTNPIWYNARSTNDVKQLILSSQQQQFNIHTLMSKNSSTKTIYKVFYTENPSDVVNSSEYLSDDKGQACLSYVFANDSCDQGTFCSKSPYLNNSAIGSAPYAPNYCHHWIEYVPNLELNNKKMLFDNKTFFQSNSFTSEISRNHEQEELLKMMMHTMGKSDEECKKLYGYDNIGNSPVYHGKPLLTVAGEILEVAPWFFLDSDFYYVLKLIKNCSYPYYVTAIASSQVFTNTPFENVTPEGKKAPQPYKRKIIKYLEGNTNNAKISLDMLDGDGKHRYDESSWLYLNDGTGRRGFYDVLMHCELQKQVLKTNVISNHSWTVLKTPAEQKKVMANKFEEIRDLSNSLNYLNEKYASENVQVQYLPRNEKYAALKNIYKNAAANLLHRGKNIVKMTPTFSPENHSVHITRMTTTAAYDTVELIVHGEEKNQVQGNPAAFDSVLIETHTKDFHLEVTLEELKQAGCHYESEPVTDSSTQTDHHPSTKSKNIGYYSKASHKSFLEKLRALETDAATKVENETDKTALLFVEKNRRQKRWIRAVDPSTKLQASENIFVRLFVHIPSRVQHAQLRVCLLKNGQPVSNAVADCVALESANSCHETYLECLKVEQQDLRDRVIHNYSYESEDSAQRLSKIQDMIDKTEDRMTKAPRAFSFEENGTTIVIPSKNSLQNSVIVGEETTCEETSDFAIHFLDGHLYENTSESKKYMVRTPQRILLAVLTPDGEYWHFEDELKEDSEVKLTLNRLQDCHVMGCLVDGHGNRMTAMSGDFDEDRREIDWKDADAVNPLKTELSSLGFEKYAAPHNDTYNAATRKTLAPKYEIPTEKSSTSPIIKALVEAGVNTILDEKQLLKNTSAVIRRRPLLLTNNYQDPPAASTMNFKYSTFHAYYALVNYMSHGDFDVVMASQVHSWRSALLTSSPMGTLEVYLKFLVKNAQFNDKLVNDFQNFFDEFQSTTRSTTLSTIKLFDGVIKGLESAGGFYPFVVVLDDADRLCQNVMIYSEMGGSFKILPKQKMNYVVQRQAYNAKNYYNYMSKYYNMTPPVPATYKKHWPKKTLVKPAVPGSINWQTYYNNNVSDIDDVVTALHKSIELIVNKYVDGLCVTGAKYWNTTKGVSACKNLLTRLVSSYQQKENRRVGAKSTTLIDYFTDNLKTYLLLASKKSADFVTSKKFTQNERNSMISIFTPFVNALTDKMLVATLWGRHSAPLPLPSGQGGEQINPTSITETPSPTVSSVKTRVDKGVTSMINEAIDNDYRITNTHLSKIHLQHVVHSYGYTPFWKYLYSKSAGVNMWVKYFQRIEKIEKQTDPTFDISKYSLPGNIPSTVSALETITHPDNPSDVSVEDYVTYAAKQTLVVGKLTIELKSWPTTPPATTMQKSEWGALKFQIKDDCPQSTQYFRTLLNSMNFSDKTLSSKPENQMLGVRTFLKDAQKFNYGSERLKFWQYFSLKDCFNRCVFGTVHSNVVRALSVIESSGNPHISEAIETSGMSLIVYNYYASGIDNGLENPPKAGVEFSVIDPPKNADIMKIFELKVDTSGAKPLTTYAIPDFTLDRFNFDVLFQHTSMYVGKLYDFSFSDVEFDPKMGYGMKLIVTKTVYTGLSSAMTDPATVGEDNQTHAPKANYWKKNDRDLADTHNTYEKNNNSYVKSLQLKANQTPRVNLFVVDKNGVPHTAKVAKMRDPTAADGNVPDSCIVILLTSLSRWQTRNGDGDSQTTMWKDLTKDDFDLSPTTQTPEKDFRESVEGNRKSLWDDFDSRSSLFFLYSSPIANNQNHAQKKATSAPYLCTGENAPLGSAGNDKMLLQQHFIGSALDKTRSALNARYNVSMGDRPHHDDTPFCAVRVLTPTHCKGSLISGGLDDATSIAAEPIGPIYYVAVRNVRSPTAGSDSSHTINFQTAALIKVCPKVTSFRKISCIPDLPGGANPDYNQYAQDAWETDHSHPNIYPVEWGQNVNTATPSATAPVYPFASYNSTDAKLHQYVGSNSNDNTDLKISDFAVKGGVGFDSGTTSSAVAILGVGVGIFIQLSAVPNYAAFLITQGSNTPQPNIVHDNWLAGRMRIKGNSAAVSGFEITFVKNSLVADNTYYMSSSESHIPTLMGLIEPSDLSQFYSFWYHNSSGSPKPDVWSTGVLEVQVETDPAAGTWVTLTDTGGATITVSNLINIKNDLFSDDYSLYPANSFTKINSMINTEGTHKIIEKNSSAVALSLTAEYTNFSNVANFPAVTIVEADVTKANPSHGTVQLGNFTNTPSGAKSTLTQNLSYTPNSNYTGYDSFSLTVLHNGVAVFTQAYTVKVVEPNDLDSVDTYVNLNRLATDKDIDLNVHLDGSIIPQSAVASTVGELPSAITVTYAGTTATINYDATAENFDFAVRVLQEDSGGVQKHTETSVHVIFDELSTSRTQNWSSDYTLVHNVRRQPKDADHMPHPHDKSPLTLDFTIQNVTNTLADSIIYSLSSLVGSSVIAAIMAYTLFKGGATCCGGRGCALRGVKGNRCGVSGALYAGACGLLVGAAFMGLHFLSSNYLSNKLPISQVNTIMQSLHTLLMFVPAGLAGGALNLNWAGRIGKLGRGCGCRGGPDEDEDEQTNDDAEDDEAEDDREDDAVENEDDGAGGDEPEPEPEFEPEPEPEPQPNAGRTEISRDGRGSAADQAASETCPLNDGLGGGAPAAGSPAEGVFEQLKSLVSSILNSGQQVQLELEELAGAITDGDLLTQSDPPSPETLSKTVVSLSDSLEQLKRLNPNRYRLYMRNQLAASSTSTFFSLIEDGITTMTDQEKTLFIKSAFQASFLSVQSKKPYRRSSSAFPLANVLNPAVYPQKYLNYLTLVSNLDTLNTLLHANNYSTITSIDGSFPMVNYWDPVYSKTQSTLHLPYNIQPNGLVPKPLNAPKASRTALLKPLSHQMLSNNLATVKMGDMPVKDNTILQNVGLMGADDNPVYRSNNYAQVPPYTTKNRVYNKEYNVYEYTKYEQGMAIKNQQYYKVYADSSNQVSSHGDVNFSSNGEIGMNAVDNEKSAFISMRDHVNACENHVNKTNEDAQQAGLGNIDAQQSADAKKYMSEIKKQNSASESSGLLLEGTLSTTDRNPCEDEDEDEPEDADEGEPTDDPDFDLVDEESPETGEVLDAFDGSVEDISGEGLEAAAEALSVAVDADIAAILASAADAVMGLLGGAFAAISELVSDEGFMLILLILV